MLTHLFSIEIQPHTVVISDRMSVCPASLPSTLEVFTTHQTRIHVDIAQALGAQLFKVKIKGLPRDLKGSISLTSKETRYGLTVSRYMSLLVRSSSSLTSSRPSSSLISSSTGGVNVEADSISGADVAGGSSLGSC